MLCTPILVCYEILLLLLLLILILLLLLVISEARLNYAAVGHLGTH